MLLTSLQLLATFSAAIFAGAALYVTLVEHPVRFHLEASAALAQWAPSYECGTRMQAPLAIVASLAAIGAWLMGGGTPWFLAAFLIGAVVPFTFAAIMPTNKALLALGRDGRSQDARALLLKWGRLHAVRTALSIIATVLMLGGMYGV